MPARRRTAHQPPSISRAQSKQCENAKPWHDRLGQAPPGFAVVWNEVQARLCDAKLWPQARLMRPMIRQLSRLAQHHVVLGSRMSGDRLAYAPPASSTDYEALATASAIIHRLIRFLEAENHYLDIRLPKAVDVRRKILEIEVRPRLGRKPIASQLKQLERAARSGDPLVWEAAWRGTTMPALRVLDQAQKEATAARRDPLRMRVEFWQGGQILSSPIPTAEYIAKLLPIAQRIAARRRNPGRQSDDATLRSLCAVFRTLTGHDAEVRRGGHRHEGRKLDQRARGSAVLFFLWLMFCFRVVLVASGAYSTWRRAVLGRERGATKAADRKKTMNFGTTEAER